MIVCSMYSIANLPLSFYSCRCLAVWWFLADCTVALMLQCCVRPSSVTLCSDVAKWCVLEQKLLLTAYRKMYKKLIGTKMNDLDLCLEVV